MRRVAITGVGITSCLGSDIETVADALRQGRSGVCLVPERKTLGLHCALAGVVKPYALPTLPRGFKVQLGRNGQMAVTAAAQAVADAGLCPEDLMGERCGAVIGSDGNMEAVFDPIYQCHAQGRPMPAMTPIRGMVPTVPANLSVLYKMRGRCFAVGTACSSGATAIVEAAQLIALGKQDVMFAGGVQEGSWQHDMVLDGLRVYSSREDDPAGASRPFDKDRDGLVPSGGCGILLLEDYERAVARGARIRAELVGSAITADGFDVTAPSGEGLLRCMRTALMEAGLAADQVDYINAHATSTPVGDAVEAKAIAELFGDRPFVSSTKSITGHELVASGATEAIYTLLMMEHGFIAPTINLHTLDDSCAAIRHVPNESIPAKIDVALSNAAGFGGLNASLIFKRPG